VARKEAIHSNILTYNIYIYICKPFLRHTQMSVSPEFHEDKKESIQMMSLDFWSIYVYIYVYIPLLYYIMFDCLAYLSLRQTNEASQRLANATGSAWHHEETWVQLDGPGDGAEDLQGELCMSAHLEHTFFVGSRSSQKSFKDGITANHHMPACCGHVGALNKACTKHFNFQDLL